MLRPSCSPAAVNAHARRSAPALAVSLLLASLVVSTPAARPEEEPTLLQRLRELFNCSELFSNRIDSGPQSFPSGLLARNAKRGNTKRRNTPAHHILTSR